MKTLIEPPEIDSQALEEVLANAPTQSENGQEPFQIKIDGIIYEVHIDATAKAELERREREQKAKKRRKPKKRLGGKAGKIG